MFHKLRLMAAPLLTVLNEFVHSEFHCIILHRASSSQTVKWVCKWFCTNHLLSNTQTKMIYCERLLGMRYAIRAIHRYAIRIHAASQSVCLNARPYKTQRRNFNQDSCTSDSGTHTTLAVEAFVLMSLTRIAFSYQFSLRWRSELTLTAELYDSETPSIDFPATVWSSSAQIFLQLLFCAALCSK